MQKDDNYTKVIQAIRGLGKKRAILYIRPLM